MLAVALSAVLGRALGAADFGLFFLVTSMALFGQVIVDWGQSQFMMAEVARARDEAGGLLGSLLVLRLVGNLVMSALTALTAHLLGYDPRTVVFAAIMVLAMMPFHLAQGFGIVFRGCERMELDSSVSVLNKVSTVGLTVLLLLGFGAGVAGAILSQAAGGLLAVITAAILFRRLSLPPIRPSLDGVRTLIRGGTPILLFSLAVAAQTYIDAVVLSKLAPPDSVGWFAAARNIFGTLIAPATILAMAAYPALARAAVDQNRLAAEVQVSTRPLVTLAALGAVGTYLYADEAVALIYGKVGFAPAGQVLKVFAPGLFLLFLDMLLATAVVAHGRTKSMAVAKWLSLITTTAMSIALVPVFERRFGNGGMALAVAFAVSEVIMLAAALWLLPRGTVNRATLMDCGRALLAGAGTLAIVTVLPPLPLPLGIAVCVVSFGLFARAVRLMRVGEIVRVLAALRERPPG